MATTRAGGRSASGPSHAAFLRAINVGGKGQVGMAELREAFTASGCHDVSSWIQSGNVLFAAPGGSLERVRPRIVAAVSELLQGDAVIVFRTVAELSALVRQDPFAGRVEDGDTKLYVAFLAEAPRRWPALPLASEKDGLEVLSRRGLDLLLLSRRLRSGRFGFPNNFVEQTLGVAATSRNWNTVRRVAQLAAGPGGG